MTESEIRYAQLRAEVHGLREIMTYMLAELKGHNDEQVNEVGAFLDGSVEFFTQTLQHMVDQANNEDKPTVEAITGVSVQAYKGNMEFIKRAFVTLAAAERAHKELLS